ncbi:15621_t:CDS:2 [Cetraspora pellucida]|uniref:15621_t:CDS:1 n=1 Tax=Cetraspora pellucida TaxID=1433469 RepID=A0ACA9KI95_9GLOM|nr:15621_t:CDS:2 [Cetraspora pellucida]
MAKIATSFVKHYKLTLQTSLPQLSSYVEELASKLLNGKTKEQAQKTRDQAKRHFQELELSKEQADTLIPIRASRRHVDERDLIKIIAQDIIKNNLLPEEINEIAYDLAFSDLTNVQLACRHKIGHASSVEHYGVMNDRPNTPASKQENTTVELLLAIFDIVFIKTIIERKITVKALIDTTSKSNTISKRLYNKLEENYRLEGISGDDLIGKEIKCLDLQFWYKGKW